MVQNVRGFESHNIIISCIVFILLLRNVIILGQSIPIGYSLNIYSQLPDSYWHSSIIIYFLASLLILSDKKMARLAAIVFLLLNFTTNFAIPFELGYHNYGRCDELTHIGEIRNICYGGHVDPINIYPATHIIFSFVSLVSDIDPTKISFLLSAFFSIMFVIGLFVSARFFNQGGVNNNYLLICACSIYYLGFYHFSNAPNFIFFSLIPTFLFILYTYMYRRTVSTTLILIVFISTISLGHPFIFLFVAYTLLSMSIVGKLKDCDYNLNIIMVFVILIFMAWILYNSAALHSFDKVLSAFISGITQPVTSSGIEKISKINLHGLDLMKLIVVYYGRYILPILSIAILFIYRLTRRLSLQYDEICNINRLCHLLMLFGIFEVCFLINPVITHGVDRVTNLNYTVMAIVPLFAISLNHIIIKKYSIQMGLVLASLILTLTFALSLCSLLTSPMILHPNMVTTYNEVSGMEWLFDHKDKEPIYDIFGDLGQRYSYLLYGMSSTSQRFNRDILYIYEGRIKDHFDYTNQVNIYINDGYIVIPTFAEIVYQTIWVDVDRFNKSDFAKFESDTSVAKIYTSLNIKIYKV